MRQQTKSFFTVLLILTVLVTFAHTASAGVLADAVKSVSDALKGQNAGAVRELAQRQTALNSHPLASMVSGEALKIIRTSEPVILAARDTTTGIEIYLRLVELDRSQSLAIDVISKKPMTVKFDALHARFTGSAPQQIYNPSLIKMNVATERMEAQVRRELINGGVTLELNELRASHLAARGLGGDGQITYLIETVRIPPSVAAQVDAKTLLSIVSGLSKAEL